LRFFNTIDKNNFEKILIFLLEIWCILAIWE
jgi:hypothetical protein